jgi:hypothetical protein
MTLPLSRRALSFRVGITSRFADPASIPSSTGYRDVAWHPANNAVAAASFATPFAIAYTWSNLGFGTRFADPTVLPTGSARGVSFSPSGQAVVFGHITTPFITAYRWTAAAGFGAKYVNPAALPPGNGNSIIFNKAGTVVFVATDGVTNGTSVYPWSDATGFGTRFSNPSSAIPNASRGVALSANEQLIAITTANSPFINVYVWSNTTGFGTKFADPAVLPPGEGRPGVAFNPSTTALAMIHDSSGAPSISVYRWSSAGFGAKFSNPPGVGFNASPAVGSVQFNKAGDVILWTNTNVEPRVYAFQWSDSGFGQQLNVAPAVGIDLRVVFLNSRENTLLAGLNQSPFIAAFTWN